MPQRLSVPKIKERMQLLGLNTAKLVVKSQLSESTVDRILHGRANNYSDFTVQRLALALECPVLELLDDESTSAALTAFTARTVEGVVAESIAENVTVVVENVAPDVSPEAVAKSVPNTPVSVPSAMDVSAYFSYIQERHKAELASMVAAHDQHVSDLRAERRSLRIACTMLSFLLLLAVLFGGIL